VAILEEKKFGGNAWAPAGFFPEVDKFIAVATVFTSFLTKT